MYGHTRRIHSFFSVLLSDFLFQQLVAVKYVGHSGPSRVLWCIVHQFCDQAGCFLAQYCYVCVHVWLSSDVAIEE